SLSGFAFASGGIQQVLANDIFELRKKVKLRFIVASDAHYGQPKTDYDNFLINSISRINEIHAASPLDFCVINGDIIHDKKEFLTSAKSRIDQLKMPYFVTKGNHDMVSDDYWNEVWNMPVNHQVIIKNNAILLGTTSNEQGKYLSPNLDWLKAQLDQSKKNKNALLFIHIPQAKWTVNGIETAEFFELLKNYPNVKAVFHGHEHDQDGVKMRNGVPFIFDSHIGGSWGTEYKGFRVVELMKDNSMLTYMMNPTIKLKEDVF
ncbi:MAG: metallophosphoesterase, partial [Bacteroidota bacterium]